MVVLTFQFLFLHIYYIVHTQNKMIISNGQMLKRDMAFTGTSGVIKFENTSSEVLNNIISSGMEHHMALAYGDHREILKEVAKCMQIPVLEI